MNMTELTRGVQPLADDERLVSAGPFGGTLAIEAVTADAENRLHSASVDAYASAWHGCEPHGHRMADDAMVWHIHNPGAA